ncbi:hypothetical protein ACNYS0_20290 [Streptomyces sp. BH034]
MTRKKNRAQLRRSVTRRPSAAVPDPNGNRAQRRAAEREQRKREEDDQT